MSSPNQLKAMLKLNLNRNIKEEEAFRNLFTQEKALKTAHSEHSLKEHLVNLSWTLSNRISGYQELGENDISDKIRKLTKEFLLNLIILSRNRAAVRIQNFYKGISYI